MSDKAFVNMASVLLAKNDVAIKVAKDAKNTFNLDDKTYRRLVNTLIASGIGAGGGGLLGAFFTKPSKNDRETSARRRRNIALGALAGALAGGGGYNVVSFLKGRRNDAKATGFLDSLLDNIPMPMSKETFSKLPPDERLKMTSRKGLAALAGLGIGGSTFLRLSDLINNQSFNRAVQELSSELSSEANNAAQHIPNIYGNTVDDIQNFVNNLLNYPQDPFARDVRNLITREVSLINPIEKLRSFIINRRVREAERDIMAFLRDRGFTELYNNINTIVQNVPTNQADIAWQYLAENLYQTYTRPEIARNVSELDRAALLQALANRLRSSQAVNINRISTPWHGAIASDTLNKILAHMSDVDRYTLARGGKYLLPLLLGYGTYAMLE